MILIDSNILVRYANLNDPLYSHVDQLINNLNAQGEQLGIVPQNIYEFWVVASRPIANNGLNLSTSEIEKAKQRFTQFFKFLPDHPRLYGEWESLVVHHHCKGKVCHDARLIAAMLTHGISTLLTFNIPDFTRFQGRITLMDANQMLQP
jgi:predicted nucleic acid-binding protein